MHLIASTFEIDLVIGRGVAVGIHVALAAFLFTAAFGMDRKICADKAAQGRQDYCSHLCLKPYVNNSVTVSEIEIIDSK